MKKPSEILIGARELLASPLNWTKGYYAKTQLRDQCEAEDSRAYCFCMVGALARAAGKTTELGHEDSYQRATTPELEYLVKATGETHIPGYNDDSERTHAEVIAAFDKAIQLAQADGQ